MKLHNILSRHTPIKRFSLFILTGVGVYMSRYHYLSNKTILFNYLDSWRKQLSAISSEHSNAAQQIKLFISFANKLLKANLPAEKKKLLTALQQQKHFAGKDWIEGELASPKRKPAKI